MFCFKVLLGSGVKAYLVQGLSFSLDRVYAGDKLKLMSFSGVLLSSNDIQQTLLFYYRDDISMPV
jgi:hypothetical protein